MQVDELGKNIIPILSCILQRLVEKNDQLPLDSSNPSKFHAIYPPQITMRAYLARIAKYAMCSGECFVLALVYIDRIIEFNPHFIVNSLNIHRLIITSVIPP